MRTITVKVIDGECVVVMGNPVEMMGCCFGLTRSELQWRTPCTSVDDELGRCAELLPSKLEKEEVGPSGFETRAPSDEAAVSFM